MNPIENDFNEFGFSKDGRLRLTHCLYHHTHKPTCVVNLEDGGFWCFECGTSLAKNEIVNAEQWHLDRKKSPITRIGDVAHNVEQLAKEDA